MTIADALTAAGLVVHDARVAPRPGAFEPLAVLWHHTGTPNPPKPGTPASLRVCQEGRADLPGPLCQWLVNASGEWWWITDGKANHAGKGSRDVLNWLIQQGGRPPNPPAPGVDNYDAGNRFFVGVEVEGSGNWSPAVHRSMLVGTRALLAFYGLPRDNLIAHKEHTRRKPDPAGIDMAAARRSLNSQLEDDMTPDEHNALIHAEKEATDARWQSQQNAQAIEALHAKIDQLGPGSGLSEGDVKKIVDAVIAEIAD